MVLKEHVGPVQRYRGQFPKTMIKSSFLRLPILLKKKKIISFEVPDLQNFILQSNLYNHKKFCFSKKLLDCRVVE